MAITWRGHNMVKLPKLNLPDVDLPSFGEIGHEFNKRLGFHPLALIYTQGETL